MKRTVEGSILAWVMIVGPLMTLAGFGMMTLSSRTSRTAAWSSDRVQVRALVDSALEEQTFRLVKDADRPGTELNRHLRERPQGSWSPVTIEGIAPVRTIAEGEALASREGSTVSVEHRARITRLLKVSSDLGERAGMIRVEARVTLTRAGRTVTESAWADRSFRVSRTTPGDAFAGVGVFVGVPHAKILPQIGSKQFAVAGARDFPSTLIDLVTKAAPAGFGTVPVTKVPQMGRDLELLCPTPLMARAQYVTSTVKELGAFLAPRGRAGARLVGVIHNASEEPLQLDFESFHGDAMISSLGPIVVGNVTMADPARDRLTIVSAHTLLVTGATVEAALVNVNAQSAGIAFKRQSSVRGMLLSSRFPTGAGLGGTELASTSIQYAPVFESLDPYHAVLAPSPLAIERGTGEWSE